MTKDHKLGVKIGGVSMIPSYIYMSVLQFLLLFGCTSIIGIELPSKGKIYFWIVVGLIAICFGQVDCLSYLCYTVLMVIINL